MKKLLLIPMSLITIVCYSQKKSTSEIAATIPVPFSFTIIDSVKDDGNLYARAKLFIAETFNSAINVIQMDDAGAGLLLVKGLYGIYMVGPGSFGSVAQYGDVGFQMKIQVKDKKYKISMTDFVHESSPGSFLAGGSLDNEKPACLTASMPTKWWVKIKAKALEKATATLEDFKKHMTDSSIEKF